MSAERPHSSEFSYREQNSINRPQNSYCDVKSTKNENSHLISHDSIYENKLPVNLFHSSTQYNKMLITNGRSIKKQSEPYIDGYIDNLQFINDPFFQSCQQKKGQLRRIQNTSPQKNPNSYTLECQCCCCQQFCPVCASNTKCDQQKFHNNMQPMSNQEIKRKFSSIKKKKQNKKKPKKVVTSKRQIGQFQLGNIQSFEPQGSSSYLSHKSFNIDHLICNSLIKFEERKRERKIYELQQQKMKESRKQAMKILEKNVRQNNKEMLKYSKSKDKIKTRSRSQVRMDYWKNRREDISRELKKKIPRAMSLQKKSKGQMCKHKPNIPESQIELLRKQYGEKAQHTISKQKMCARKEAKEKQKKLKKVEENRKKELNKCMKKKFSPSPQMIENAFVDLAKS